MDNSEIQLLDGTTKTIEEIVQNQSVDEIPCIDFDTKKLTKGKITDYHDVGVEETITITLASGKKVGGTFQHPVIMKNRANRTPRWERLDKIKVGYQVGVPKSLPYFGENHNKDARLLGMLIGDGSYSCAGTVWYGSEDKELWDYIKENYPNSNIDVRDSWTTKKGNLFQSARITKLTPITAEAKIHGDKSVNKKLPYNVMSWDKESICELIGGLYDTDGCVHVENNQKHAKVTIKYTTISPQIANSLQKLLCKLGIHAYIKSYYPPKDFCNAKNLAYDLLVRDKESVENFYHNIKLLVPHKQKALENGFKILQNHKCKIPKNLIDTDLRFEKVVKVEFTGKHHVYDLTVDKHHSFIANNIFVHNTNAKLVKIGTPKTRNHFYDCVEGKASNKWTVIKRDWTQCAQSWALGAIYLPDPKTGIVRPYSKFIVEQAMPKALKEEMFPNNPEVWTEGNLDIEDFRTQYMLEFIDGAGKFLTSVQVDKMRSGEFDWLDHGIIGENYVAGIDFAGANPEGDATQISVLRINRDGTKNKVFGKEFKDATYPEQMYYIAGLLGGANPRFKCSKIFADYTGCGAAVVQTLQDEYGMRNIEGIIFNSRDRYTNSGMNMKNAMYGRWRQELDNGRFFYPTKERFLNSPTKCAGKDNVNYYHRMIGEWADLEQTTTGFSVNKKIEAPSGYHDDVCDADVLANFATNSGQRSTMPKAGHGRYRWR